MVKLYLKVIKTIKSVFATTFYFFSWLINKIIEFHDHFLKYLLQSEILWKRKYEKATYELNAE